MTPEEDKRFNDFQIWLLEFQKLASQDFFSTNLLEFDNEAAHYLNLNYWAITNSAKGYMLNSNNRLNFAKIAAGVSLSILIVQPFENPIASNHRSILEGINRINAKFAWTCSIKIILKKLEESLFEDLISSDRLNKKLEIFFSEPAYIELAEFHLTWLEKQNWEFSSKEGYSKIPYFIMAQFWQVLYNWMNSYCKS
jgi:hypothetical protein